MSATPTFVTTPKIGPIELSNSDSANTKKTLVTAGANGAKVASVTATLTDTVDRVAQLWLTRSATSYLLGSVTIPAGSGNDGVLFTVDLFSLVPGLPFDINGQPYLLLESADKLDISATTQVAAAKKLHAIAVFASF